MPETVRIMPYFHSYAEYSALLDSCISDYGMADGELNELGKMIVDYKACVKEMNIKENWSVLRYIGKSQSNESAFDGFIHGRYYYLAGVDEHHGGRFHIIDYEEYQAYAYPPDSTVWEIVEDPTGMAEKLMKRR